MIHLRTLCNLTHNYTVTKDNLVVVQLVVCVCGEVVFYPAEFLNDIRYTMCVTSAYEVPIGSNIYVEPFLMLVSVFMTIYTGDIGGQMGICLGMSALTLIEMAEVCIRIITRTCLRKRT